MKHKPLEKFSLDLSNVFEREDPSFIKVKCPSCSKIVVAEDINIHDKIAKCQSCNAVFSISTTIHELTNAIKPKQAHFRPEGIELFEFEDELDISMNQSVSPVEIVGLFVFFLFAGIATLVFLKKGTIPMLVPSFMWILTSIPMISILMNKRHKIYININQTELSIIRRPKKFNKDQYYEKDQVDQLYVKSNDAGQFNLMIVVNGVEGQKHITLISTISSLSKAKYLEQSIESYMQIKDRKIPEEIK